MDLPRRQQHLKHLEVKPRRAMLEWKALPHLSSNFSFLKEVSSATEMSRATQTVPLTRQTFRSTLKFGVKSPLASRLSISTQCLCLWTVESKHGFESTRNPRHPSMILWSFQACALTSTLLKTHFEIAQVAFVTAVISDPKESQHFHQA